MINPTFKPGAATVGGDVPVSPKMRIVEFFTRKDPYPQKRKPGLGCRLNVGYEYIQGFRMPHDLEDVTTKRLGVPFQGPHKPKPECLRTFDA